MKKVFPKTDVTDLDNLSEENRNVIIKNVYPEPIIKGSLLQGDSGKGKNHLKIKLKEMFGIEATDKQTDELENCVFESKGFHVITETDIKNSKSYRLNPNTGEIKTNSK